MSTLFDIAPGQRLIIEGLAPAASPEIRAHLAAWGLLPGTEAMLIAHRPVTRLLVEHAELALEHTVARQVHARRHE